MTLQDLEKALIKVKAEISIFSNVNKISNQQRRQKTRLLQQRDVLEKIQQARAKSDLSREAHLTAYYNLLVQEKNVNPVIHYIMKLKFKSTLWI